MNGSGIVELTDMTALNPCLIFVFLEKTIVEKWRTSLTRSRALKLIMFIFLVAHILKIKTH